MALRRDSAVYSSTQNSGDHPGASSPPADRSAPPLLVPIAPTNPAYARAKRATDLVLSALALIVLAPIFLAIALAILLTSGRPVIYRQTRLGLGGKPFTLYKFRTMVPNAEAQLFSNPELLEEFKRSWKLSNDYRVTPIGSVLRKTSLDELPQLVNILIGDMSIVGPRPVQIPEIREVYGDRAGKLLSVTPGLTGLWQTSGRSNLHYRDRVSLDMEYIDKRSLLLDLKILLGTIPVVIARTGAR